MNRRARICNAQYEEGSTSLELMIWVLVAGMLISASVPTIKKLRAGGEGLQHFCRELVSILDEQALLALHGESDRTLQFAKTSITLQTNGQTFNLLSLPKDITLADVNFSSVGSKKSSLILRDDGTASAGKVTFASFKRTCTVVQARLGRRRIQ